MSYTQVNQMKLMKQQTLNIKILMLKKTIINKSRQVLIFKSTIDLEQILKTAYLKTHKQLWCMKLVKLEELVILVFKIIKQITSIWVFLTNQLIT